MLKELKKVVAVDEEKCINCHSCITACPVKFCNDGSGSFVEVNENLCIGCGRCIPACTHEARYHIDNFEEFARDLNRKVPIVAIVAPAIASNFPDHYLNFNGWLIVDNDIAREGPRRSRANSHRKRLDERQDDLRQRARTNSVVRQELAPQLRR